MLIAAISFSHNNVSVIELYLNLSLKLHFVFFLQTHLETHVSTRDVVSCFPKQMNPGSSPSTVTNFNHSPNSKPSTHHFMSIFNIGEVQSCQNGTETVANPVQQHPDLSQVCVYPTDTYLAFISSTYFSHTLQYYSDR